MVYILKQPCSPNRINAIEVCSSRRAWRRARDVGIGAVSESWLLPTKSINSNNGNRVYGRLGNGE